MKKFSVMLLGVLFAFASCSDSNSDDPTPTPVNYTIMYKVVSTGTVNMDTIMYLDAKGVEQFVMGESQLNISFVQPSNNYHAKFYMSGEIGASGNCDYTIAAMMPDSSFANYESGNVGTGASFFKKTVEFSNVSN